MPKKPAPEFVPPPTLGACADLLYKLRAQRLAIEATAEAVEVKEKALKDHIIRLLPKAQASGIAGKLARASRVEKTVASVKDWPKLYAYIKKNNAFEMLQKRVVDTAVAERWDAGKTVPGVEPFTVVTLSVTKV